MNEILPLDALAGLASALALWLYHRWLRLQEIRFPTWTVQQFNRLARTAWVQAMMSKPGSEILAVQTLRNSTMAATFFASTSVLLIIGVLNLAGQANAPNSPWHVLNVLGSPEPEWWMVKLLAIVIDLFAAFFAFALSLRVYNHVGYLLNVPDRFRHPEHTPEKVAVLLNSAGDYYSLGMRAYYFSVPLVFWLFGALFLVIATLTLLLLLYRIDQAPRTPDKLPPET